jgi:ligand-binding sensor domain-containing protein
MNASTKALPALPSSRSRQLFAALALAAWVVVPTVLGLWLSTPARIHDTALWLERAQRIPAPVVYSPDRASLSLGGGAVTQLRMRARVLETRALPTESPVTTITEGDRGLAVATFDDGAWLLHEGARAEPLAAGTAVNGLAFDEKGQLFAATDEGALRLDAAGPVRLGSGAFTAVAVWQGKPWFTSRRGLSALEAKGLTTFSAPNGFTAQSPAALAGCGAVLCVGAADGLWTFDGALFQRRTSGSQDLPTDYVTAVAFAEGEVWAGTFDAGLSRLGAKGTRRFATSDGLPEGRVQPRALTAVGSTAFAATPSGLMVVSGESAALIAEGLPRAELTAVAPAREGGLWVGYRGGVSRVLVEDQP